MKQHPVPQHISSYEFKLVGDMTLKQFFQLAGGAILALIVYALPFPGYVKWPFVVIFGALGAALAFLPIEERPLSTWIFAFLKAVYSPTKFSYNENSVEEIFSKSTAAGAGASPLSEQYLAKPAKTSLFESFETAEKNFFNKVTTLFQTGNHPSESQQAPAPQPTNLQPTGPDPEQSRRGQILTVNVEPPQQPQQAPMPKGPMFKVEEEINIPQLNSVKVGAPAPQPTPQPTVTPQMPGVAPKPVFTNLGDRFSQIKIATYDHSAQAPAPADRPNTIVGQVLTLDGKIIDGAILEIRDHEKRPVRAIRTNKVGHFLTVTPLQDGEYEIDTEKEGYIFDPVKFIAKGEIIPPIQIKAKT